MSETPVTEIASSSRQPGGPPSRARRAAIWLRSTHPVVLTVFAFVASIVVGGILIVITDTPTRKAAKYFFSSPGDTFSKAWHAVSQAYITLFEGAIFDPHTAFKGNFWHALNPLSETLLNATPLILGGLAVGLAFRTGLFNIGAQGQLIFGAIFAGYVGFAWHLPVVVHVIVALVAGVIGGGLWGGLSGWLKARTGAHEVITTIMLNYVAVYLLGYLLTENGFKRSGSNQAISRIVDSNARLPKLFPEPLRVHTGLIIALLAAAGVAWLLNRSKRGFQLRAVGANQFAARTAGMDVGRNYVVSMMLSGALAGLAGCSQILGTNSSITQDIDAGIGFTAITVALLGRAQPWPTVLAGILYGAFQAGGVTMQSRTGTPIDLVNVLQSIIVLFIAAPALVGAIFRLRGAAETSGQQLAKGWNG
ncbi:MAG TPA: ABC transporter permease [Acidothermaceae bacterium]|nr:ABC transporter permease [Acidothermaceae bacterium]